MIYVYMLLIALGVQVVGFACVGLAARRLSRTLMRSAVARPMASGARNDLVAATRDPRAAR